MGRSESLSAVAASHLHDMAVATAKNTCAMGSILRSADVKASFQSDIGIFCTHPASGSSLPLRLQRDASENPALLPPGTIVEAALSESFGSRWAMIGAAERARLGINMQDDVWLDLDADGIYHIGGRRELGGSVWVARSLFEGLDAPEPAALAQAPIEKADSDYKGGPLAGIESALSTDVLSNLQRDGYVVVDNALPETLCCQLRQEMLELLSHGEMWTSESFATEEGVAHHDIEETDLDNANVRDHAPTFARIETDDGLLRCLRRLPSLQGLSFQHVRLQVNHGNGGCYTMHTDSGYDIGGASQVLQATALFYLNPAWKPGDGGELRLFPFPSPPVEIAPVSGRLVFFEPRMVHEVLPNHKQRLCFTLWCSGREGSRPVGDFDLACEPDLTKVAALSNDKRRSHDLSVPYDEWLPLPLCSLFLPEMRPLLVRFIWRSYELAAIQNSHSGTQRDEMLSGISAHHAATEQLSPKWFLDILESLPAAAASERIEESAEGEGPRDEKVHAPELAALIRSHTSWWC